MSRRFRVVVTLFVCCLFAAAASQVAAEQSWKAGLAKTAITPDAPMWMAGYASRNRPADGKVSDLWAKALVLEDADGRQAVLVTLDLIGIDRGLSLSVCKQLQERYELERDQIVLSTSHTHSGPVVRRNLAPMHYLSLDAAQQQLVDRYTRRLEEKILEVVDAAWENREPCRLSWGAGAATFAVNRRENKEPLVPQLRAAGRLNGPVDHDVPVLAIYDERDELRGIVFGYACHATVFSAYQWSGDYPGFAQTELETLHPGCVAMFWAGCGGDQNPVPRRELSLGRHYGRRLADAVESVLLTTETSPVAPRLSTRYQEVDLPLGPLPTRTEIERDTAAENEYVAARARMLLDQLNAGESLTATYPYPIGVWKLGDDPQVQWLWLGGEVVVDYAIRLKQELSGGSTWVAAYANDVMAYIPSARVLREGGYEGGGAMVYYGLPASWAPAVEQIIIQAVHEHSE